MSDEKLLKRAFADESAEADAAVKILRTRLNRDTRNLHLSAVPRRDSGINFLGELVELRTKHRTVVAEVATLRRLKDNAEHVHRSEIEALRDEARKAARLHSGRIADHKACIAENTRLVQRLGEARSELHDFTTVVGGLRKIFTKYVSEAKS